MFWESILKNVWLCLNSEPTLYGDKVQFRILILHGPLSTVVEVTGTLPNSDTYIPSVMHCRFGQVDPDLKLGKRICKVVTVESR